MLRSRRINVYCHRLGHLMNLADRSPWGPAPLQILPPRTILASFLLL